VEPVAELTPLDHVNEAIAFYRAVADVDDHNITCIFIAFPDMNHAVKWAVAMGIDDRVWLVAPSPTTDAKYFNKPVIICYEF